MTPTSLTRRAIAASSKRAYEWFLRAAGFSRERNHAHRVVPGLVHGIHFQASQWGSATDGSFTVNLVVTSPVLYHAYKGFTLPSNPATADSPIRVRLGHLMPSNEDSWWSVSADTKLDSLATDVSTRLREFALPFLDSFPDSTALLARLRTGAALPCVEPFQAQLVHAILAAQIGSVSEAKDQLARALTDVNANPLGVRLVASRIGVALQ